LGPPSEIRRLAAPLTRLVDAAWQRMHWWVITMAVLYAVSGITIIRPDEVAVVLRWGRLVGSTPALQQHGPGLLFAFPRPIDRVVRVQVKRVSELVIDTLTTTTQWGYAGTLDPLTEGYALTGDRNVVHVEMVARYRVREPAEWSFYGPPAEDVLRAEVTAAMVRSLGEMGVDRVLADGRKDLVAITTRRAQAGLDDAHSGLELTSLELTRLSPPVALASHFEAVQSAFIGAETSKKEALAFAQTAIPQAQGAVDKSLQAARADAASQLAEARGESGAFLALAKEYRANPLVVRERLYRDAVERATSIAGSLRWVPPPPEGGRYQGLRISIPSTQSREERAVLVPRDDDPLNREAPVWEEDEEN
jgi:membrane protease subunit HflK